MHILPATHIPDNRLYRASSAIRLVARNMAFALVETRNGLQNVMTRQLIMYSLLPHQK